jgi:hypothetical protein
VAVTVTELVEYTTTDNGASYSTGSYTPTASRGLVACILATATDHHLTPTVTGNGVTWGLEDAAARGAHAMWVFTAYSGTTPTTTGLTVEINPADPAIGILIWVAELGNVDPTTESFFVQAAHGAFDADETPVLSYAATTASTSAVIGFLGTALNPAAQTQPTSWTLAADNGIANPIVGTSVAYRTDPGAISSVTWGSTPAAVSTLTIMEIAVSAAGSTTATPTTVAAVAAIPTPTVAAPAVLTLSSVAAETSVATPSVSTVAVTSDPKKRRLGPRWGLVYEGHVGRRTDAPRL